MSADLVDAPFARPIMVGAMAAMIVATVGGNVLFNPGVSVAPVLALALPYLGLATVGWVWCERRGGRVLPAFLVALLGLTLAILWASDQALFLLVFPPLVFVILYAGVGWGVATIVAITVFAAGLNASAGRSVVEIYLRSTGFVPGAILTVAFSSMLLRERRAQRELAELATTRERNRIARDIHDSVGHYLTVVNVQIEAARAIVAVDPAGADECLGRAQGLARDGLAELRRSVSMLRAGPLDQRPFGVALARLVDDARQAGASARLMVEGPLRALPPALEFVLYRAAQEALTNVARHARATTARCTLRYLDGEVRLIIADDGVGATEAGGGFGLAGMRERVAAVGGTVDVATTPGAGFTIDVRLPT